MARGMTVLKALMEDGKRIRERELNGEWGPWTVPAEAWGLRLVAFFNREWEIEGESGMTGEEGWEEDESGLTIREAVQAMEEGKMVRRPLDNIGKVWKYVRKAGRDTEAYYGSQVAENGGPYEGEWGPQSWCFEDLSAQDWQSYREMKGTECPTRLEALQFLMDTSKKRLFTDEKLALYQLGQREAVFQLEKRWPALFRQEIVSDAMRDNPCNDPEGEKTTVESDQYQEAFDRFAWELLAFDENVQSIHGRRVEDTMQVWIVVRENTLATRYAAYTAQLKTDRDLLLSLYFTESLQTVPFGTEKVVSR